MIKAEIKRHTEPAPYVYTHSTTQPAVKVGGALLQLPYGSTKTAVNLFSQIECNSAHQACLKEGINIGNKYRVKNNHVTIEIIGFKLAAPYVDSIEGQPAIIRGKRISLMDTKEFEFDYSLDEILEMEKV